MVRAFASRSAAALHGMTRRLRAGAKTLVCMLLVGSLQGCLLTRLMETRTQLCDEQPPRVVVIQAPGSGLRILFQNPTLTDRDVIWMAGFPPSEIVDIGGVREFSYDARPVQRPRDPAASLVFKLSFKPVDGEYRLSEMKLPEKLSTIVPPPLLGAAVKIACKARVVALRQSTTLDLTEVDLATLPTREGLQQLLGAPTAETMSTREMSVQYCLVPCDAQPVRVASFMFAFSAPGRMERAEANYFRYWAIVDLLSPTPTATFELR